MDQNILETKWEKKKKTGGNYIKIVTIITRTVELASERTGG